MGIILSGTRVAWIGLFFILLFSHPLRSLKKKIFILLLILLTLWQFFPLIEHRIGIQVEEGKLVLGGAGGGTAQDRLEVWKWLIDNPIPQSLWIGHGLGSSLVILKGLPPQLVGAFDYPHNEYLRILLEGGIVGLSLFACSWIYMGWYFYSTYKKWVFILPIAIFSVFCFGDNTLNNYFENGGVLAYILAYLSKLESSPKDRNI
jgi:O-antigen ligase